MTLRERILSVYAGQTPDVVPYFLDLSHWFYWKNQLPWDLSTAYTEPERALIDFHRQVGAGFYMPNGGAMFSATFPDQVRSTTEKQDAGGVPEIVWRLETASGLIERRRKWEERTYAWGINQWGIRTPADLRVFGEAMAQRSYTSDWAQYLAWDEYVGDDGVVYLSAGYSAMGHLLNYWMGIEQTMYATVDIPEVMTDVVEKVNANNLELIDLLCTSPAHIIILGDNFSSDIQPPRFFARWSRPYYAEAIRRLHAAGKKVAVHIDGQLRGALGMFRDIDADCADAVTPAPLGDLSPSECRAEAGSDFILSGGVSPELWLSTSPRELFEAKVKDWLALKRDSPRLIANAGDQVPPGAEEDRIHIMRDLVDEFGRR
ncbi:MAG TPA: uroporphyrinogen decarboxylase family protein [Candidatus Latescibacteria bacterium]|jgi:hypothetical protein|nr:hypothetical protein [Gemmatimonadaceae bacterium]MDP6017827.1 uroporphyrinogen decarboxylase family protein [Candidatus Latescibacterota bacterium]HJP30376.1 uroporphyrinogen decarboxylase family protein [Candidatus Latescibacterota bacterium]